MRLFPLAAFGAALLLSGCISAMNQAALSGDTDKLQKLIAGGGNVNEWGIDSKNSNSFPLNSAVRNGHIEAARVLLGAGANPNSHDSYGLTPLHQAIEIGAKLEMIKLLLDNGADPTISCGWNDYKTPVDMAQRPEYNRTPDIAQIRRMLAEASGRIRREKQGIEAVASGAVAPSTPVEAGPVTAPASVLPAERARLSPSFKSPEANDDYAVIVGIENYPDLPAATFAERDAAAMKNFIHALGVPERNIILLTGSRATKSGLEKMIEDWLPNNVSERSRVYFYYSGHGAPDPKSGSAYLLPSDGDPQYLARTGYPLKQLYFQLGQLKAKQVLVALDSCFSGAGGRSVIAKGTRPLVGKIDTAVQSDGKMTVISASAGDQVSGANDEAGYGLFTYNFLRGLNGGAKDAQGRVTIKSLYGYLKPRVQDEARRGNRDQAPQLQGDESWTLR